MTSPPRNAVAAWPCRREGGITGRGADILIVDDPSKPDETLSDPIRNGVNGWFDSTAYTRLNSKQHGAVVIIMQRLHLDDLTGHVLGQGGWELVSLPAIAEEDTVHEFDTLGGHKKVVRRAGTALHPEREPLEILQTIRDTLGDYAFSGQYQQAPVPLGGGMIKCDWLTRYETSELPGKFEHVIQSWDTASKNHQFADYSAGVTLGVKDKIIYVLDVVRKRMDFPTLKAEVEAAYRKHKPDTILVEDASSGIQLVQELKASRIYAVKPIKPEKDKQTRVFSQQARFESGAVRLPANAPWLDDFVHELTSFPFTGYDDQVDAICQGLIYLRDRLDEPGIWTYYREEAERLRRQGLV